MPGRVAASRLFIFERFIKKNGCNHLDQFYSAMSQRKTFTVFRQYFFLLSS
jgi:hypothetical protein